MQQAATQRRLAAILAADVVGFSRMMGADEEGTLARLKRVREEVTDPAVAEFRGRIFKTTGDGLLAEFPSVVDAVKCAAKVQVEMARRNKEAGPAGQKIVFRVGINLGDVIVEGDDLYGDGVNVAARLEGVCEPGSVALSASGWEQVRGKVPHAFIDRGEFQVKNIARPVRVYGLDLRSHGVAFRRRIPTRLRRTLALAALAALASVSVYYFSLFKGQKPVAAATIAVLPFANQSGDAKRDYFSDGVTEDIVNALGRFSGVRVASYSAVQGYKCRSPGREEVSRDLGVRYLVQGSVREADGRVRVAVELADAANGAQLWSERYEGSGKQMFEIQDRIVRNVVGALAVKVTALEQQRGAAKPPESLEAYDLVLRARELLNRSDRATNREARALLAQALQVSPDYAEAYAALAHAELGRALFGWIEDPAEAVRRSEEAAARAVASGDTGATARALVVLANLHTFTGNFDAALKEADRALELNPSDAYAYSLRAGVLMWLGRTEEAIAAGETARRFQPRFPSEASFNLSMAYYLGGRYKDALATVNATLRSEPEQVFLQAVRGASAAQLGDAREAREAAEAVRRLDPFFKVESFGNRLVDAGQRAKAQEGLRKAGL